MQPKKYKIRLSKENIGILTNDALDFGLNRNSILNIIIFNHYQNYIQRTKEFMKGIATKNKNITDHEKFEIYKQINTKSTNVDNVDQQLLPVSSTREIMEYLELNTQLYFEKTISELLKNIVSDYCEKSKYIRESIIFKDTFETINTAIAEGKMISFLYSNKIRNVSPYCMQPSIDEVGYYLNSETDTNDIRTFKLRLIKNCIILKMENSNFTKLELLEKEKQNGSRYGIDSMDHTIIYLTNNGKVMFDKIFHDRPEPISIKKDLLTVNKFEFNWKLEFDYSGMGIDDYFIRFGAEVYYLPSNYNYEKIKNSVEKLYKLYE